MLDEDFIHQHPFMTTAAALGVGLLLGPVALSFLALGDAGNAEQKKAGAKKAKRKKTSAGTKDPDSAGMLDEDFIHQHPFMTTAAALGVGLLAGPVGLSLLVQRGTEKPEDAEAERPKSRITPAEKTRPEPIGVRLPWPRALPHSASDGQAHDVGALDMEFTTHRPDGKNIEFSFGWKKRPVDALETAWPVDNMGFTVDRPSGKHVAFNFTRKTRPVPAGYGDPSIDGIRSGLGQATMKFASSRPDRGEFRFTWEKVPPDATPTGDQRPARNSADNKGEVAEASTVGKQKKRTVSKASRKPASR